MKTTLLIPVKNEIDSMRIIMPQIKREWVDQIIVLDGNSTDGSAEYARESGYFVYVQKQRGLRRGYHEVFPYIEGDIVILFSPDGNSIPELIPPLIDKMKEGYDMVIVSRYLDGAKSLDDDWLTRIGNRVFTGLISVLFGYRYTDAMVIYRAVRRDVIVKLGMDKDPPHALEEKWDFVGMRVSWEPQFSMRCAKNKLRIAEIPGDEPKRIGGIRKMKPFRAGFAVLIQMFKELTVAPQV